MITACSRRGGSDAVAIAPGIRRIEFASCYTYVPVGAGFVPERSRGFRDSIKSGDEACIRRCVIRVEELARSTDLRGFFDATAVLVPVPGSAPSEASGAPSVAERIATAMIGVGLGGEAWAGLRRKHGVRKSGTAPAGGRPSVTEHIASLSMEAPVRHTGVVMLIDDIVTRGRTLLAAAACLHEALPTARIKAFALMRAVLATAAPRLLDPCRGEIVWCRGDARRCP